MIYKLQKNGKNFQLIAIENPPPEKQVAYGNAVSSTAHNEIANVAEQLPESSSPEGEASLDADGTETPSESGAEEGEPSEAEDNTGDASSEEGEEGASPSDEEE